MNRACVLPVALAMLLEACSGKAETTNVKDSWQDLQVQDLQQQIARLKEDYAAYERRKTATLIPSDKGYSTLLTDAGPLAVTMQSVEPYADGSRVHLRIGNMTSATLLDIRANVRWGSVNAKSEFVGETRSDTWRELPGPFPPGHWHSNTLDLAGVPPSKLGKVELSYGSVNHVSMPTE